MKTYVVLFLVFMIFATLQFAFPLLASIIKSRLSDRGFEMKSRPAFAMFNMSKFWSEAREINKKYNDHVVSRILMFYTLFWVLGGLIFVCLIFANAW